MESIVTNNIDIKDIDFPILLNKMSKDFNRDYGEFLKPYGLSKIHSLYLLCLYKRENGMKLKDLNETLGCDKANTSRAIADMQDKGIISKDTDNNNEKKYAVKLTELGFKVADEFSCLVRENVNKQISKLTQNEVETLMCIFRKLVLEEKGENNDSD